MQCCGEERTTPYCPECGKGLIVEANRRLKSLIAYLRSNAERHQRREANSAKWIAENKDADKNEIHNANYNRRAGKRNGDKWQSWVDAVEKLIASQGK